ncbi:MAG: two-component regulator propeller domain-containing protein, partial [Bacteroidales bacterium]|nr:two-component regulator propeller domain-containing protein [Bacteroidales bacterium]
MPIKAFLFLLVLFLQLTIISAQQPFYRNYSSQHGLPSSEVYDVQQDAKGYLWFTTDHGLARFDGYQFRTFDMLDGMPENSAFYLKPDKQERIWFNTYTGKLGYIEKDKIFSYKYNEELLQFYAENNIKYVVFHNYYPQDDGSILFNIFDEGMFKIDTSGVISQVSTAADTGKLKIEIFQNGKVIIAMPPSKLIETIELSASTKTSFHDITQFKLQRYSQNFFNVKHNNKGKTYLSAGRTIFLFDGHILAKTLSLDHLILRLGIDKEDNVWIGTISGGAYVFNSEMKLVRRLLEGESVTGFLQDHEGGIWLTSLNKGIYYFPEINQRIYSKNTGLPDKAISSMAIDKNGTIWFTNKNNTLGRITQDELKLFTLNLPNEILIQRLLPDLLNERLLIATNQKLYYFDYTTRKTGTICSEKTVPDNFNMFGIKTMVQDVNTGEIFNGHFSGISNLLPDGTSTINSYYSNTFLNRVESIAIGKDASLWLGTSTGLYHFADQKFEYLGDHFPLLADRISALVFENDSLWIGTRGNGLLLLHNDNLIQITRNDGLVSNSINSILITAQTILAGSNNGFSVLKREQDQKKISILHNNTASSGLYGNEVTAIAQYENEIFVATTEGITIFDDLLKVKNIRMPVHITSVAIDNKKRSISKLTEIPFYEQNLAIEYFAISYAIQGRHTYRHRLAGLEDEWIINQKTTAQYPYLPPGEYIFEVEVMNPDGSWNPATDKLIFVVMKPFWRQWWFLAIASLLSLFLIIVVFRLAY